MNAHRELVNKGWRHAAGKSSHHFSVERKNSQQKIERGHVKILHKDKVTTKSIVRELAILKDSIFTTCVPKLLAQSDYGSWFVLEEGQVFDLYWKEKSKLLSAEEKKNKALQIIREIAELLSIFHKQKLVHLDIKPKNLILIKNQFGEKIKIIDFSTASSIGSKIETAKGNRGFSPYACMYNDEIVKPWFDIFNVAQLLVWMLDTSDKKHWERPMDWRYAKYDSDLDENTKLYLRALTAQCSNEKTCPSDALKFIELLDSFFGYKNEITIEGVSPKLIEDGKKYGRSQKITKLENDAMELEANSVKARIFYKEIRTGLSGFINKMKNDKVDFVISTDKDTESAELFSSSELFQIDFKGDSSIFYFRISAEAYTPSRKSTMNTSFLPPDDVNIIVFYLTVNANLNRVNPPFPPESKIIYLKQNNTAYLADEKPDGFCQNSKVTTTADIISLVKNWIYGNEERWVLVNS